MKNPTRTRTETPSLLHLHLLLVLRIGTELLPCAGARCYVPFSC
jgi:hypothetical protein